MTNTISVTGNAHARSLLVRQARDGHGRRLDRRVRLAQSQVRVGPGGALGRHDHRGALEHRVDHAAVRRPLAHVLARLARLQCSLAVRHDRVAPVGARALDPLGDALHGGRDAELKFIPSGAAVLEVPIADTPRRKTDTGWEDAGDTVWYRVSVWGPMAEALVSLVTKGTQVTVTGTLTVRTYQKDGIDRQSLDIRAETVGVREKRGAGQGGTRATTAPAKADDPWATAAPATGQDQPPW